ncbi:MAG TPA: hypothetical protein VGM86_24710, partial [Thermoanaerobaculia bacterium]
LLGIEYLSEAAQALLRKAFEEGALQFNSRRDASSLSIPERCIVAPILAPVLKAEIHDSMVRAQVSHGEVEQIAKGGPRIGSGGAVAKNGLSKLFLSISFADLPEPTLARGLFQAIFGELGIKVVEGLGIGSASLDQIKKQLEATDLTLVDLTYLRPNVVFEMGLTLGVSNRLVPLFNKGMLIRPSLESYPFLADMGHLEYALNPDDIRELREKVLTWADRPLSDAHILATSITRGIRLRVGQSSNSMAIYYPESREGLWKSLLDGIRKIGAASQVELAIMTARPFRHDLTSLLDHIVWCISRSERIIIDTTGASEPDLLGAFALGFAYGCSAKGSAKEIIRFEEASVSYKSLSMWPSESYRRWRNHDHLFGLIKEFMPRRRKRGR